MSVEGCFADFKVEAGGSSLWFHVHEGTRTFWIVQPTDANLKAFENWYLTRQTKGWSFFAENIPSQCQRFTLNAGQTLFIPSGWVYASYTNNDCISFTGNFLHSFAMVQQLQVAIMEENLDIPERLRFPFFVELQWYALDRFVYCLTGKTFLDLPLEEKKRIRLEKGENVDPNEEIFKFVSAGNFSPPEEPIHLTKAEIDGLKAIVMFLHQLPTTKKKIPVFIPNPSALILAIKTVVLE